MYAFRLIVLQKDDIPRPVDPVVPTQPLQLPVVDSVVSSDEEVEEDRKDRDPVAPAEPSESAKQKRKTKRNDNGQQVHSFRTLLADLGQRCRVTYRVNAGDSEGTFHQVPDPTPLQAEAMRLLGL